ncbi:hypothetical protein Tco_1441287 [Tanacetum coccineum]
MNITSPSSSLEQINFLLEDWGTNLSDSSIEFSFRTCSVVMEANGSGVTKIVLLGLEGQVNVVRVRGVNVVKSSTYWIWRPTKSNGASLAFKRHNYIDARGRSNKSVMAWVPKEN